MTQSQLHRAIARRTGESVSTIQSRGFNLVTDPLEENFDHLGADAADAYCLDCPGCGHPVFLTDGLLDSLPEFAECTGCDAAYPFDVTEVYDRQLVECA